MFNLKEKINQLKYFKNILDKTEIKDMIFLFVLMFASMLLEILILNYILKILNYFSGNKLSVNFLNSESFNYFLSFANKEKILLTIFALLFFIKSMFLIYVLKKENLFLNKLRANVSNKLFSGYTDMPLIFKMRTSTSDLIKNITNEVDFFISTAYAFSIVTMEILILLGISFYLMFYSFKISAIAIVLFFFAGVVFNFFNKRKILKFSSQRSYHLEKRVQFIIEALSGLKDLKLFGVIEKIKKNFNFHNNQISRIGYFTNFRNSITKPFFELFVVLLIFLFVLYANLNSENVSNYLPLIGVFLFASYRLIPSLSRIISSIQRIQLNFSSVVKISNDFIKFKNLDKPTFSNYKDIKFKFIKNIEFKNIWFSYKESPRFKNDFIIRNLNFKIEKGEKIGICGESGSGKSTFLDLFLGLYQPHKGKITLDNLDFNKNRNNWQHVVSCVPQEIFIKNDSLINNISFDNSIQDRKFLNDIIDKAGLRQLVESMDNGLDTLVGDKGFKLSSGQKQRVAIARALYFKPQVLVLDESTSSLDTYNESIIIKEIISNKNNFTLLWVSHNKQIFKKFKKCYELKNGTLNIL
jgi:ABC-type multidrug transport system fused ATPase/permease subunit